MQIDPRKGRDAPARSTPRSATCSTTFPNQLVEIYSVLAERIGETLSGESAPFFDQRDRFGSRRRRSRSARRSSRCCERLPDSGNVRLTVPPREVELQLSCCPSSWPSTVCRPRMYCRPSMPLITAARWPNSIRRIAACRWSCASRDAGADPHAARRAACVDGTARWCRYRPVAKIEHGARRAA